jgi:hypothetical protein
MLTVSSTNDSSLESIAPFRYRTNDAEMSSNSICFKIFLPHVDGSYRRFVTVTEFHGNSFVTFTDMCVRSTVLPVDSSYRLLLSTLIDLTLVPNACKLGD